MQNTIVAQERTHRGLRRASLLALAAVLALAACAFVAAQPQQALAKSYDMPKVDITAQAETDGSLHAVEQRVFDFNGDFTAVWWTIDVPQNAQLQVNSVRIANADKENAVAGEWTQLSDVPFVLDWREAGGPGTEAYSVDTPKNMVYVFFNAIDERKIVELDYTVVNGVQAYKDVGEVYWKYVGDQWAEPSDNVTMTLALPVPQGTAVEPGNNVRAWGHGPLDGNVKINEDGTVTFTNPHVNAGQYAEARVVFPVSWLTNLSGEEALIHRNDAHLEQVLKDEQTWADQANRTRVLSLAFIIGCGAICVLLIAWALRMYFKHGKEYEPTFKDEYWRDVPSPQDHPAVIGRLWRWDRESQDDFTATLMHLSHIGAIQINKGSYEKPGLFGEKPVDDYFLTRVPAVADAITDPVDRAALDVLFGTVAGGADSLWFGSIEKFGKDHAQEFLDTMKAWQGTLSQAANQRDFFEIKGKKLQGAMIGIAALLVVVGVGLGLVTANFIPLIFMVPTAIALIVIGNYMPRRSREGNEIAAKAKALRNWLRDFSSLDERPPTDVKVWGEFMVYAYLFGVAEQVMKELRTSVPQVFESDDAYAGNAYFVPWWFWYAPSYGASGGVMPAAGSLLQTSVANTISTAQAALSGASGGFSSGGGFGGGFSSGGGGGFGGGGGAR